MNRVMTPLLALLVSGLMASALHAGDAEKEAGKKFLESQTEINADVLGSQTLKVRMLGHDVGSMTLNIEKGELDGKACYVVSTSGNIDMGVKSVIEGKSYLAPDLSLLQGEETEKEDGELTKHSLYTLKDGVLTAAFKQPEEKDEAKRDQSFEIKPETGLLMGTAEMLITVLLPREKGTSYEFIRWDSTAKRTYPLLIESAGNDDYDNKTVFKFVENDKKFNEDELGNVTSKDVKNTLWFDGHTLVSMDSADGFQLETNDAPKHTPITREMIDKRDNEKYVVAGFFLGANNKDEALLKAVLNEFQIVRRSLDDNPMAQGASDEEKDQLAKAYADTVVQNIMKQDEGKEKTAKDKARETKVTEMLMNEENFVSEVKDDVQIVHFSEAAAKMFGNLVFVLEKDDDGKWEIVAIDQKSDEEETADTPPEKKDNKDGEGKKDEEDGF